MARKSNEHAGLLKGPDDTSVVYLLDASTDYEASLLTRWAADSGIPSAPTVRITSSRRGKGGDDKTLDGLMRSETDPYLIPLRVLWMAPEKEGRRSVSWSELFKPGDPRDPKVLRARLIRWFSPKRVKLIAATGAQSSDLVADYEQSDQLDPLASYTTRRAWRVLDQAERKLRGNRYKIPRFVPEAILARREFVDAVATAAAESGMDPEKAMKKAERYLHEIAATHSPYVIDIIANGIHSLYTQGYGGIHYRDEEVQRIAELGQTNPLVFLPSHRSNLDRLSLQFMLWENDLPPNHTAGGINMNFFPLGPLMRRTGVFFIRRSFRENTLYKTVLRSYLDFLVEKKFPLEWYLEGGRSRTGRLLPPRLGLLHYVVDAYRRGKAEDIQLIPVSIAYDQIQDVPDYAREAQGKDKESESIGWLFRAVRSMRRSYGDIYIRIGPSVSMSSVIGSIESDEEDAVGLQKLAFEVMYRIGAVTPITPTALVSVALLAEQGAAKTAEQLSVTCHQIAEFVRARGIEMTGEFEPSRAQDVAFVLQELSENGNVSSHEALGRIVYWLDEEQMIRLSYYWNVVVHHFIPRALAEMAITSLIENDQGDAETLTEVLLGFRDLLKFEFYFQEKERFLEDTSTDVSIDVPNWQEFLRTNGPSELLAKLGDPVAAGAVLPILDAYQIVGDELESLTGSFDEKKFLKACLARARMYRIEDRVITGESASQIMFKSALRLAENRNLLEDTPQVVEARRRFAEEVRTARALAAKGL